MVEGQGDALPETSGQPHECFGPRLLALIQGTGDAAFNTLETECTVFDGCPKTSLTRPRSPGEEHDEMPVRQRRRLDVSATHC
jgi:hypothetical protein